MIRALSLFVLMASGVAAAQSPDLHKTIQGQWVVDEQARLEASPLYQLSPPAKKKSLAAGLKTVPATRFVFTPTTVAVAGADPVAYKVMSRTATSLVLDTAASADGLMPKDEMTIQYVSAGALTLTAKSQGITLLLSRAK